MLMQAWFSTVIELAALFMLGLFISLFWWWGGVKGNALGYLAVGLYFFTSGLLFIYIATINAYARMDNAYLGNGLFGLYLLLSGGILLFGSLAGFGIRWPFALLGGIATVMVAILLQGVIAPHLLLSSAIFAGIVLLIVFVRRRGAAAVIATLMAGISVVILWWNYGAGTMAFIPVDSVDAVNPYKPPYLDLGVFALSLCLGGVLVVVAHFLQIALAKPRTTTVRESPQL